MQTITDEIAIQMKKRGEPAISIEGYEQGEWILSDYSDLIVHVFNEKLARVLRSRPPLEEGTVVDVPAE